MAVVHAVCPSCQRLLDVSDRLAGRQLMCPGCGGRVVIGAQRASAGPPDVPKARRADPVPKRLPEPELAPDEDEDPPSPPKRKSRAPRDVVADDEDVPVQRPKRRKKKNKKRRVSLDDDDRRGVPAWVWWAAAGVTSFLVFGLMVITVKAFGLDEGLPWFLVALAFMLPISTIILVGSMFLASAIGGGIDFGEVQTAIPKAIILLMITNFIYLMIPFGGYLNFAVWIIGLMGMFGLDFWESRLLIVVNGGVNFVLKMFLISFLVSMAMHGDKDKDADKPTGDGTALEQVDDADDGAQMPRKSSNQKPLKLRGLFPGQR